MALTLGVALIGLAYLLSKNARMDHQKISPFECGFIPKNIQRDNFSVQFFLIALIFLIFDIELVILFPYLVKSSFLVGRNQISWFVLLVFLLAIGLVIEWSQKMLQWSKL